MVLPASYSTVAEIYDRYPPIGSMSAVITSRQIADAIGAIQARIDATLACRYAVPFSPSLPPVIQMIAGDLATLRLFDTRVMGNPGKGFDPKQAEAWTQQWRSSEKLLSQLATGAIKLPTGSGTLLAQNASGIGEVWSNTSTTTPAFVGQDFPDVWATSSPRYWP